MSRKKSSPIWEIEKDELQNLLDSSFSIVDVILKLGLNPYNGNHKTINNRIKIDNLSLIKLNENRKIEFSSRNFSKLTNESVFKENSDYSRTHLKKRLIELIEYKCDECKITNMYNGKPISLQIDHKNGINNDNRIENLRLLCPNCHSQTDTFSGKNKSGQLNKVCIDCNVKINKKSNRCMKCSGKIQSIKQYLVSNKCPSEEELINDNITFRGNFKAIGRKYNVTDNSIRRWFKRYNIISFKNK